MSTKPCIVLIVFTLSTFLFAKLLGNAHIPRVMDTIGEQDWTSVILDQEKARNELADKLVGIASNKNLAESDRWKAVAALGRIDSHQAIEYLVDNISLKFVPPIIDRQIDNGEERACYWALMHQKTSRSSSDGTNWNIARAVLGAISKPRKEDEQWRYAYLLDKSLGPVRMSDRKESPSPRALALVESEITSEEEEVPGEADGEQSKVRKIRITNLKAIRKVLAEKRQ
jgi:hypothetical protein